MGRATRLLRLAPALSLSCVELAALGASAQTPVQSQGLVVRDGTLGSGPPEVGSGLDPNGNFANYLIRADLGEQRGGNLFHSFRLFGIGKGEVATFTEQGAPNPGTIDNVISRVTGGARSEIDGTLRSTIPGADVWLLNPSGVVFGAGSKLEVPGSFHASTGDYVGFGDGDLVRFYADPSRPSVLSTSTPTAFGFLSASGAAAIAVDHAALEVPQGETLELVGGDVSLTRNAALRARSGHVGLEAQGQVDISQSLVDVGREGDTPGTISIRGGKIVVEKSSLVLAENESSVPAASDDPGPGRIALDASESVLVDASLLSVSTHGAGNAGTLDIESPQVTLRNGLGFDPQAPPQVTQAGLSAETTSSGAGGEIRIQGDDVTLANGIDVSASAVGPAVSGRAGNVAIAAAKVAVERESRVAAENTSSLPSPDPDEPGPGRISVEAGESVFVDNSVLSVNTWSAGNAGTIEIGGLGDGRRPDVTFQNGHGIQDWNVPAVADVGARAETTGSGAGGEILIEARNLTVRNGAAVNGNAVGSASPVDPTLFEARGRGGRIGIRADSIEVAERSAIGSYGWKSPGRAGDVEIDVGHLRVGGLVEGPFVDHYAFVAAGSEGGIPGTLEIRAGSVEVLNGGMIHSNCDSCTGKRGGVEGAPASVRVTANSVEVNRGGSILANGGGLGDAGTIEIEADSLSIGGGTIGAATNGEGTGGTIGVLADQVVVESGGALKAGTTNAGAGGTIAIGSALQPVKSLTIHSGGSIDATTSGTGDAGTIKIGADSVLLRGEPDAPSWIDVGALGTAATGNGGTIDITAGTFAIEHGGLINAGPRQKARGDAGDIHVAASDSIDITNAGGPRFSLKRDVLQLPSDSPPVFPTGIFSATVFGRNGGEITLDAPRIRIAEGAIVATSTVAGGDAGNILLGSRKRGHRILIESGGAVDSTSFPDLSGHSGGAAGSVTLEADRSIEVIGRHPVFQHDRSRVGSASLGEGAPGAVTLRAPRIVVDGGAVGTGAVPFVSGGAGTAGGTIKLEARELVVRGGGQINATSLGQGTAGSIEVAPFRSLATRRSPSSIRVEGAGSGIVSRTGASGDGGDIALRATRIDLLDGGEVSARSAPGRGEIESILASLFDDGLLKDPPSEATGPAGQITLEADTVRLRGAKLKLDSVSADGGNVTIQAKRLLHLDRGEITASVNGGPETTGGNITIDPEVVRLENGSSIVATAAGGHGGSIQITADNYFAFPSSEVSADSELGIDGVVAVHTPDVDLAGNLTPLPTNFLDASSLMRERCAARRSGEPSGSFAVRGNGGVPPEPDGWLRAPVLPDTEATAEAAPALPILAASFPGPLLAAGTCE